MARISQDSDSWKAGGVIHRDFRHTHDGPEVSKYKRKRPKTRKRGDHHHVFVDVTNTPEAPYWSKWTPWYISRTSASYRRYLRERRFLRCAQDGCAKYKIQRFS